MRAKFCSGGREGLGIGDCLLSEAHCSFVRAISKLSRVELLMGLCMMAIGESGVDVWRFEVG